MPEKVRLQVTVNGVEHDVLVEPRMLVLDFLRDELDLTGAEPTDDAISRAADRAARDLDPPGDPHGSADFRRHLAVVMTRRSVQRAAERAREGAPNA